MKSQGQVKHKLKQVLFRHMKRHLSSSLSRVPDNCMYNRIPTTAEGQVLEQLPSLCIHAMQAGCVCDASSENSVEYARCPYFQPKKSKQALKDDFVLLAKSDRAIVAETMPDAAALMWVLDENEPVSDIADSLDDGSDDEELSAEGGLIMPDSVLPLSLWDRVALWKGWPWNWRG